jgi:hypothetical protein
MPGLVEAVLADIAALARGMRGARAAAELGAS